MVSCNTSSTKPPWDCVTIRQAQQTVFMADAELARGAKRRHVFISLHKGDQMRSAPSSPNARL